MAKKKKTVIDTTADTTISDDELTTALGQFIKPTEFKQDDVVEITSPAWLQTSRFGEFRVVQIKYNNQLRILRLNKISLTNLVNAFGNDSRKWVGKKAKVEVTKVLNNTAVVLHPLTS